MLAILVSCSSAPLPHLHIVFEFSDVCWLFQWPRPYLVMVSCSDWCRPSSSRQNFDMGISGLAWANNATPASSWPTLALSCCRAILLSWRGRDGESTHWPLGDVAVIWKSIIFKLILKDSSLVIQCKIALRWMPQDLVNEKSTSVQVMA